MNCPHPTHANPRRSVWGPAVVAGVHSAVPGANLFPGAVRRSNAWQASQPIDIAPGECTLSISTHLEVAQSTCCERGRGCGAWSPRKACAHEDPPCLNPRALLEHPPGMFKKLFGNPRNGSGPTVSTTTTTKTVDAIQKLSEVRHGGAGTPHASPARAPPAGMVCLQARGIEVLLQDIPRMRLPRQLLNQHSPHPTPTPRRRTC